MSKKWISVVCSMSMLLVATACGQNTSQTQEVEETVTTEQVKDDGIVELTVWCAEDDTEMVQEMVDGFQNAHAGEATFQIEVAIQAEDTCRQILLADIESGADVFAFADDQLLAMVAGGALQKVSDAETISSQNLEEAVSAASIEGTLYAYPMTADNGYFMYYNTEYFSPEDVTSLDRMLEIAAEAEKKVTMDWTSGWYLYSFWGMTGMEMGINDDGVTNYCNWNATDGSIKGVDVAQAMLDIGQHPGFISLSDGDFVAGMKDGSVIAGINGTWNATNAQEAWGSHYAAAKLPTYTCGGQQIQMSSFAGYKLLGVNAYSDHVEWAEKLAAWITNEDNQNIRFARRAQGPSNVNAAASEEVAASPAIQALLQQSEFSSLQRVGGNYWTPIQSFAQTMLDGNPNGIALQELVDTLVSGITASVAQ